MAAKGGVVASSKALLLRGVISENQGLISGLATNKNRLSAPVCVSSLKSKYSKERQAIEDSYS